MKSLWWPLSIAALCGVALGIFIDKAVVNWSYITLKDEVDIFSAITSLISIIVTLAVAFWVTTVLEKRTSDERSQKDIIIQHTEQLFFIVEEIRLEVRRGQINYSLAASWIKRLNMNTSSIIVEIVKASINDCTDHEPLIQAELAVLKRLLTGSNDPELTVSNGIVHISEDRQIVVDGQLDKVRNEIFKFRLAITVADRQT